jgi:hypothetical protein
MNSIKKVYKREGIKNQILSGSGHKTHYTNKEIEPRKQLTTVLCSCEIKCANLFSETQKQEIFKRYNSLKSHSEQYLLLKSLVIPSEKEKKIRQKFDYYLEVNDNDMENEVYLSFRIRFFKNIY